MFTFVDQDDQDDQGDQNDQGEQDEQDESDESEEWDELEELEELEEQPEEEHNQGGQPEQGHWPVGMGLPLGKKSTLDDLQSALVNFSETEISENIAAGWFVQKISEWIDVSNTFYGERNIPSLLFALSCCHTTLTTAC